jgi:hypothetical protein
MGGRVSVTQKNFLSGPFELDRPLRFFQPNRSSMGR